MRRSKFYNMRLPERGAREGEGYLELSLSRKRRISFMLHCKSRSEIPLI